MELQKQLINNMYKHKLKNNVNLKKTLTIHKINKCFGMIVKLIFFTTFNGKNEKKMLFDAINKKITKICC